MAHKGPAAPSQPRTLRGRALEIGTDPAGFVDAPSGGYFPQGGHPVTADHPAQTYQEKPAGTTTSGAKPLQTNPIKIG